jgi:hypothetical protein
MRGNAAVRQALADAVNTVEGLVGLPHFQVATNVGNVLIRYDRTEYPNRFGGVVFWSLVLVLPQDLAASEEYLEAKGPALRDAVAAELVITTVTTQLIDFGAGSVPTAVFTGHREEEA